MPVLALLLAFAAPLLLIPIEAGIPAPYIIEELVKLTVVFLILKSYLLNLKSYYWWIVLAGILFTLSESVLYLVNIFMLGDLSLFGTRLLLTGGLHICTFLILAFFIRRRFPWGVVGYIMAATIHYWYNATIVRVMMGS